jgi:hypothetical protein
LLARSVIEQFDAPNKKSSNSLSKAEKALNELVEEIKLEEEKM